MSKCRRPDRAGDLQTVPFVRRNKHSVERRPVGESESGHGQSRLMQHTLHNTALITSSPPSNQTPLTCHIVPLRVDHLHRIAVFRTYRVQRQGPVLDKSDQISSDQRNHFSGNNAKYRATGILIKVDSLAKDVIPVPRQQEASPRHLNPNPAQPRRVLGRCLSRLETVKMTWELTRRRFTRAINSKYLFDRIVRSPLRSSCSTAGDCGPCAHFSNLDSTLRHCSSLCPAMLSLPPSDQHLSFSRSLFSTPQTFQRAQK